MRRIAVVTTSRADYGIYRPLLKRLNNDPAVALQLIVGGMHLKTAYGNTIADIEADGFPIAARVDMLEEDDSPLAMAQAMGRGTQLFAETFAELSPQIIVVLGDRFEMHGAAVAAQPLGIPVAHIHGGELTLGAMDDNLRHSMTKLSHLHFAATDTYAHRIAPLGEEVWRITNSGGLALDNLLDVAPMTKDALSARLDLPLDPPPLLVTHHPATRQSGDVRDQAEGLFAALDRLGLPVVFTAPNADAGGRILRKMIKTYLANHDNARLVQNLGTQAYFALMDFGAAMVGNSSSGVTEAASFKLPVVNIGTRQEGRLRPKNIIDCRRNQAAIEAAITEATSPAFKASLSDLTNPYQGTAPAAKIIHQRLTEIAIDEQLLKKGFVDLN